MMLRVPLAALLTALAAASARAALDMNEGLWETTIVVDGHAQSAGTKCYTRADIAEMEKLLQGRSTHGDGSCSYSGFTQSGNRVSYTMTCRLGADEQTSAVSATYQGDSATGTVSAAGVTLTASSRRLGPCTHSSFVP